MSNRKAVFLDLQGTLGGDGFGDVLGFVFFPFSASAIKLLNDVGLLSIVITNQTHISRGDFTYGEFEARMYELQQELAQYGAKLDGFYCCPHMPEDKCLCMKPHPGMLLQAQKDFGLDLSECYVIGDRGDADMAVARIAGCKAILVRTGLGCGSLGQYRYTWADIEPDYIAQDVLDGARWIVGIRKS